MHGSLIRGSVSEITGHKSGFSLTLTDLLDHAPDHYHDYLQTPDTETTRIRSEEFEELICALLNSLGTISTPHMIMPGMTLWHKYKDNPSKSRLIIEVQEMIVKELFDARPEPREGPVDSTPIIIKVFDQFGKDGTDIAIDFLMGMSTYLAQSPWSSFRLVDYRDRAAIKELFESESLSTQYGNFLDQRFIDYLDANSDEIFSMNWRKFEGLAGEYFHRLGLHVEMGPGRNDDGVDIRVWSDNTEAGTPPTMLVQCKRTKESAGKVVVKGLWADIQAEGAKSGLIVTTSRLAPGSQKVVTARGYPIQSVNADNLKSWIRSMRTPDSGVFLAE